MFVDLQERVWFRKICSFEFSRNNEEKRASKIIRTFSETKFKSHSWWWKWVKPKEPHCFASKVTLPQNYKRLAQLWSKMLFYKYECKYYSIPFKSFLRDTFFVIILVEMKKYIILFQDSNVETVILISPKFGLSQINSLRNSVVSIFLLELEQ